MGKEEKLLVVQFRSPSNDVFKRRCVVPNGEPRREIRQYLAESLQGTLGGIEIVKEERIFLLEELIDEDLQIGNGRIDAYWLDANEYVVEWRGGEEDSVVVGGMYSTVSEVEKHLRKKYPNETFNVDYFEECWVKRSKAPVA